VRIASLLPSATEIVCVLGLEDDLVGVTHECDYPPSIRYKPVLTASVLGDDSRSLEIDRHIRQLVHSGSSIYRLDSDLLSRLSPDLILTQELCEVCAVSYPLVERAAHLMDGETRLVSLEPESLEDVFEHVRPVGRLTGTAARAEEVVAGLEERVGAVSERSASLLKKKVVCLEWLDPPYCAGHWNPELVRLAGGVDPLGREAVPAQPLPWKQVLEADPEVIVVMACGFSLERGLGEAARLRRRAGWDQLRAVRSGDVHVVDGSAYFSRPGPRLVDSLEIMAWILHPDRFPEPAVSAHRKLDG
jgi:iron complex transport system substrate-binding protein